MMFQMVSFLLDVLAGLFAGAALLRAYMQWVRAPFGNPLGQLVFVLTDWAVLRLRRVVPAWRGADLASLILAFLIVWGEHALLALLSGARVSALGLLVVALLGLVRLAISGLSGILLIYALMSWLQGQPGWMHLFAKLCDPVLAPPRRLLPRAGGIDFSPLVALVALQLLAIAVSEMIQRAWMI